MRDNLLDLEDHHLVRIESVQEDQRQVWVLTAKGHREAKQLLEPKGIRVSALRKQEYDPDTGELLGTGYDDHAAAVTSTAAELHRAGIGHLLGFQTEVGHRLGNGFVQRADLVVRAPEAGVPVLLLEIDRRPGTRGTADAPLTRPDAPQAAEAAEGHGESVLDGVWLSPETEGRAPGRRWFLSMTAALAGTATLGGGAFLLEQTLGPHSSRRPSTSSSSHKSTGPAGPPKSLERRCRSR
ncbi:hypothetical protein [Streptomyces sp. CoH27]|uniref:hypothetical protein n=1 Tax=Streptomyces sp. CoH27 TaxID=2875763 RepID=UPI001CD1B0FB|nr:hypothetical protein [Streptomyces sp. CoH27]